jgi:hypothetical protein
MAQNISCMLKDEQGEILKNSELNFAVLNQALWQVDKNKEKYKWLHTIDEYGDTIFNHLQAPIIIAELEQLKTEVRQELQNLITEFIKFISQINTHQYIKFCGD